MSPHAPTAVEPPRPSPSPAENGAGRGPRKATATHRLVAGVLAAGGVALLTIAATLTPAAEGLGTHQQLGLPACGFLSVTGLPCMSCGMTTAFAHMAHGQPLASLAAQPMGALLYLLTVATIIIGSRTALTGWFPTGLYLRLYQPGYLNLFLLAWTAAWFYKILSIR